MMAHVGASTIEGHSFRRPARLLVAASRAERDASPSLPSTDVRWQAFKRERCAARQLQPSGDRCRPVSSPTVLERGIFSELASGCLVAARIGASGSDLERLPGFAQAPGGMGGPLRNSIRGKGEKGPEPWNGLRRPPFRQWWGQRTGAGTRTRRSRRLAALLGQRTAALLPAPDSPTATKGS